MVLCHTLIEHVKDHQEEARPFRNNNNDTLEHESQAPSQPDKYYDYIYGFDAIGSMLPL